jgi:hypothetical protein
MPTNDQVIDARKRLSEFLQFVYKLLQRLALEQRDPKGQRLFVKEIESLIKDAWAEFENDFNLDQSIERIQRLESSQLREHGLYGNQLNLKIRVVQFWNEAFEKFGGAKVFRKLIGAIDTVLESLLAPTGIPGAVKEIKDIMGDSVDD